MHRRQSIVLLLVLMVVEKSENKRTKKPNMTVTSTCYMTFTFLTNNHTWRCSLRYLKGVVSLEHAQFSCQFSAGYGWACRQSVFCLDCMQTKLMGQYKRNDPLASFKDGAYYCYCAYVLRISRYSDFLSPMLTNTGIFLRGLKLSGESRSY